jgi:anti-sigma regulatory factor (Ser/Thr protein kinase)
MDALQFYMLKGRDFTNAGRISTSIKRYLREHDYPAQVIQRVAIITYESEINLVCYTRFGYFFVYFLAGEIKIVVKDRGQGIEDVELAMQEGFSTASDEIRKMGFGAGMGLSNIKKNSDRFSIHSVPGYGTFLEVSVLINNGERSDFMGVTFKDVAGKTGFQHLTEGLDLERTITAGYAGDLLSDVNANARQGNIWVTVLTHPNAVAVAGLKELAGIIIAGGIKPGKDYLQRAFDEKIPVLFTDISSYEVISVLSSMGITGNP